MAEISIELVKPFIIATTETYRKMLGNEPEAQAPILNKGTGVSMDISGVIGLTGDLRGSVSLSYTDEAARKTLEAMMGSAVEVIDDDAMDAVGELVNIIAGYAKQFMPDFHTAISLPTVIRGSGLIVKEPADVFSFTVPFISSLGNFNLGVGLKKV